MTTPDRTAVTAALAEQWQVLADLTAGLDERQWRAPSPLPGWTVFDVMAHLVGTESSLLGEPLPQVSTEVRELPHVRNEIGAFNETWLESLRPLSGERLRQQFQDVTERRRKALAQYTDQEWNQPSDSPVGPVPYGRFMQIRQFDCWMHELDIADALGRTVDEGGPRADIAFAEMTPTIGRAIVKGAGAPDGSRITFALTGPAARQLHVVVAGRASLVAELEDPATVTIELPSGLFARLRGGRTTAAAHAGEYRIAGATELGERVVDALAFTI